MPRIRSIKPEFFDSPGTSKASTYARLLYIAMWCWADDWGIGDANPRRLLGFAFPEDDASEVQPRNFRHLAAEVADCYGVQWYAVAGREYYAIPAWEDHQKTEKRAKRRGPGPDQAERDLYPKVSEDPSLYLGSSDVGTGEQGNRGTGEPGGRPGNSTTEPDVPGALEAAGLPPRDHDAFLQALASNGIRKTAGYVLSAHRDRSLPARVEEWRTDVELASKAPRVVTASVSKTTRDQTGRPVVNLCDHGFEAGRCPQCRAAQGPAS